MAPADEDWTREWSLQIAGGLLVEDQEDPLDLHFDLEHSQ